MEGLWLARAGQAQQGRAEKEKSFSLLDLHDLLKARPDLQGEDALLAHAEALSEQGDRKLLAFCLLRKDLAEVLDRSARARNAGAASRRLALTRLELLQAAAEQAACTCTTPGRWEAAAEEVVCLNGYNNSEVQRAVYEALAQGRKKQLNILIVGETNRAKSFVLKPIDLVFNVFIPPESGPHQLAGIRGAEVVWLNEFVYDPQFLQWSKLKDFLEGQSIKVAVPKTTSGAKNYTFDGTAPVLGTAPGPIGHTSPAEIEQMDNRIRYFWFRQFFDPRTVPDIPKCKACWAKWVWASRDRALVPTPALPRELYQATKRGSRNTAAGGAGDQRAGWYCRRRAGEYREEDAPGQCFRCGSSDHYAANCPNRAE